MPLLAGILSVGIHTLLQTGQKLAYQDRQLVRRKHTRQDHVVTQHPVCASNTVETIRRPPQSLLLNLWNKILKMALVSSCCLQTLCELRVDAYPDPLGDRSVGLSPPACSRDCAQLIESAAPHPRGEA